MSGRKNASFTAPPRSWRLTSTTSGETRPDSFATVTITCCWSGASIGDVAHAADGRAPSRPPTAGGRGAGGVARGVARRGGEAGRQDRRHREAGLAALLARLAEQRDERRELVGAALGRQLLHQRLDQVRAREAGDGLRHPVGVGGPGRVVLLAGHEQPGAQERRLGVEVVGEVGEAEAHLRHGPSASACAAPVAAQRRALTSSPVRRAMTAAS